MFNPNEEIFLPKLREDLKLIEANSAENGSKQWMIFDCIANKYYNISIDTFELINYWQDGLSTKDFINYLKQNDYEIDEESLLLFIVFLKNNALVKNYDLKDVQRLYTQKKESKHSLFKWLIHNYLFIKIPLVKPDKWLNKHYHKVDFLYSSIWSNFILILGFIGIILVLRQWEEFTSTFTNFFSKEGMFYYFLSLVFIKSLHELGHAFTAKRYGCKIPSMGVAFLVMFPVLYTDTTNAYALKSKYKRLKIVVAGVKVELYLALIATFLWSFLPDGALKSITFIIATTSWITSLLINISPFLRFDGYYALTDWTNTKNLQPRSFSFTRWYLRHQLLGVNENPPEIISLGKKRFFIIYAISTWIYRFVLFLGIAVLVYYFAFKILGILLFLVEILWFIVIPIFNELKVWWSMKNEISWNKKNKISLSVFVLMIIFLIYPWNTKIHLPAVLEAQKITNIYSSKPAFIEQIFIKNTQYVKKDTVLMILKSQNLEYLILNTKKELDLLNHELEKITSNEKKLENRFVIQENILEKTQELDGLLKSKDELIIKAPFDGFVYFNNSFKINQWVNPKEAILNIYDPKTSRIIAYCKDSDIYLIKDKQNGKFIANNGELKSLDAKIYNISNISLTSIEYKELSSDYGGNIATRPTNDKNNPNPISEQAYFKIEANIEQTIDLKTRIDGEFIINAEGKSILNKFIYLVYNTLIKESSF